MLIHHSRDDCGRCLPELVSAAARDVFLALPKHMESAFRAIYEECSSSESYLTRGL